MEEELDILLQDLYGKYAPNEFSKDKVDYVKENYKDDVETFVRDFYGKYAPNEFSEDKINYIKENYDFSFKGQEVTQPTQVVTPEKKNQIETEPLASQTQTETSESTTKGIGTTTLSGEDIQRASYSTDFLAKVDDIRSKVSLSNEEKEASKQFVLDKLASEAEMRKNANQPIESKSIIGNFFDESVKTILGAFGADEEVQDVVQADKLFRKAPEIASDVLFGEFLKDEKEEAQFIMEQQGIKKDNPDYENKLNEIAKELKIEKTNIAKKEAKFTEFLEDMPDDFKDKYESFIVDEKELKNEQSNQLNNKLKAYKAIIDELTFEPEDGNFEKLENKESNINYLVKRKEDLERQITQIAGEFDAGKYDKEIESGSQRISAKVNQLEGEYRKTLTKLRDVGSELQENLSLHKNTLSELSNLDEEIGSLEQEFDLVKREYGWWSNKWMQAKAIGVGFGKTMVSAELGIRESLSNILVNLGVETLGAVGVLNEAELKGAKVGTEMASKEVFSSVKNSIKRAQKYEKGLRDKMQKPLEWSQIDSAADALDFSTNSFIESSPLILASMINPYAGALAFGSYGAGAEYEKQLELIENGEKDYSPTNVLLSMSGAAAVEQLNFLGTKVGLKSYKRVKKAFNKHGKKSLNPYKESLRNLGVSTGVASVSEQGVSVGYVLLDNLLNGKNDPLFRDGLNPIMAGMSMNLLMVSSPFAYGAASHGFRSATQSKWVKKQFQRQKELSRRLSDKNLKPETKSELRKQSVDIFRQFNNLSRKVNETVSKLSQDEFNIINKTDSKLKENKRKAIDIKQNDELTAKEKKTALNRLISESKGLLDNKESILNEASQRDNVVEPMPKEFDDTQTTTDVEAVGSQQDVDFTKKSVEDLEKRQFELEDLKDESSKKEFNDIENELIKREWRSILGAPLSEINSLVDGLIQKNKEMPNGYGSFMETKDARQTKSVVDKYQGGVSKKEAKKDFKDAFFGNPDKSYSDALKMRESVRVFIEEGGTFKELLSSVQKEFSQDGFTEQEAAGVIKSKLDKITKANIESETKTDAEVKRDSDLYELTEQEVLEAEQAFNEMSLDDAMISELENIDEGRKREITEQEENIVKRELGEYDQGDVLMYLHENLGRINPKDFDRFGDINLRKDNKSFNILYASNKAKGLDANLEAMSESFGNEITTQDVVDYIQDREANPEKYLKNQAEAKRKLKEASKIPTDAQEAFDVYKNLKYDKKSIDAVNKLRGEVLTDAQADVIIKRLKERYEGQQKTTEKKQSTEQETSRDIQRADESSVSKTKQSEKLNQAKENLKNAFNEWAESKRNVGVIYDPKSQAAQDVKLTKAIVEYLKQLGITGIENIKKAVSDFSNSEIKLNDEQAKVLETEVSKPTKKKRQKPPKNNQEAVDNISKLVKEYEEEGKDKNEFARKAKQVIDNIKEKLSPTQYKRIAKRIADASKTKTPLQLSRLGDYVSKAIQDAEYINNVDKATKAKKKVKSKIGSVKSIFPADQGQLKRSLDVDLSKLSIEETKAYAEYLDNMSKADVFNAETMLPNINKYAELAIAQENTETKKTSKPKKELTEEEKIAEEKEKKTIVKNIRDLAKSTPKFDSEAKFLTYLDILDSIDAGLKGLSLSELKDFRKEMVNVVLDGVNITNELAALKLKADMNFKSEVVKKATQGKKFNVRLTSLAKKFILNPFRSDAKKYDVKSTTTEYIRGIGLNELDMAIKGKTGREIIDVTTGVLAKKLGRMEAHSVRVSKSIDDAIAKIKGSAKAKRKEVLKMGLISTEKAHDYNKYKVKGTHKAMDFFESARQFAEGNQVGSKKYKIGDFKILEEIVKEYKDAGIINKEGKLDWVKAEKSLGKSSEKAFRVIENALAENTEFAKIASAYEGNRVDFFPYYSPISVINLNFDSVNNVLDEAQSFANSEIVYQPKSQNLKEREEQLGGKAISFDIAQSAKSAVRENLRSYYLRGEIKSLAGALNKLKADKDLNENEKAFSVALENAIKEVVEKMFVNEFYTGGLNNKFFSQLRKMGYMSDLAAPDRALNELQSNFVHASMANPKSFYGGIEFLMTTKIDNETLALAFERIGIAQTNRIWRRSGSKHLDLADVTKLQEATSGYGKVTDAVNEWLMEAPDRAIARAVAVGVMRKTFKDITGNELQLDKISDDAYFLANKDAINEARKKTDEKLSEGYASFNAFESTLMTQASRKGSGYDVVDAFSKYMIRFQITEYNTLAKAFNGILGRNEMSRREALALAAATISRMSSYTYFAPIFRQTMMTGISQAAAGMGIEIGLGEDELYPDLIDEKRAQRAVISSVIQMGILRRLDGLQSIPIKMGIEKINEEYLSVLRDGEYNKYEDSIVFNLISLDSKKGFDYEFTKFLGAYSKVADATASTLEKLIVKGYRAKEGKKLNKKNQERENNSLYKNIVKLFMTTAGAPAPRSFIQLSTHHFNREFREKENRKQRRKQSGYKGTLIDNVFDNSIERMKREDIDFEMSREEINKMRESFKR